MTPDQKLIEALGIDLELARASMQWSLSQLAAARIALREQAATVEALAAENAALRERLPTPANDTGAESDAAAQPA
jgi:hypothetical protein